MNATGLLVVGYGNVLRGDDGVGVHIAELLGGDHRFAGARVLARHQLTPELATDFSAARFVVLVDAARLPDGTPGNVRLEPVVPGRPAGPAASHAVDAGHLVELTRQLYGSVPPVMAVSVAAERFELGEGLSPAVAAAVPHAVEAIAGLIADVPAVELRTQSGKRCTASGE